MLAWIAAVFLVAGFVGLVKAFRLVELSKKVISISGRSFEVTRNTDLDDDEKEKVKYRSLSLGFSADYRRS